MSTLKNVSILPWIKNKLGIEDDFTKFDPDIIGFINSTFMELGQLGVCDPFFQIDSNGKGTWDDLVDGYEIYGTLSGIQRYIFNKVKLSFDPPGNGFLVEQLKKDNEELAFRLIVQSEGSMTEEEFDEYLNKKRARSEEND